MSTAADHAGFTIQTYVASFSALVCIVVGFLFFIRSYIQDGVSTAEIYRTNLRMAMLRASVGTTQTLLTLGTYEDFLNVYRKPLMSSVADLQAMIYMQVTKQFLRFSRGNEGAGSGADKLLAAPPGPPAGGAAPRSADGTDPATAESSMLDGRPVVDQGSEKERHTMRNKYTWHVCLFGHALTDFIAWLEVCRMQWQLMRTNDKANEVMHLLNDIKWQFEANTAIQGLKLPGQREDEGDALSHLVQLHMSELLAIGNVMLISARDESSHLSMRMPMPIHEFLRIVSIRPPPANAPLQLEYSWVKSTDYRVQNIVTPLLDQLLELGQQDETTAPTKRLAIIQVLLCKLIDMLDPNVAWDKGPAYDEEQQAPVVARNERLTPLVRYLSRQQKEWLRNRPYFKTSDPNLSFPGFRMDLASLPQEERDVHPELWPGACPPKEPRRRPPEWNKEFLFPSQRVA